MPASCSAYNCTNRWTKHSSIRFYKFPKEEVRRKKWIAAVCRVNWQPSSVSKLCSEHFESHCFEERNDKRFLKFNAVPTIFDSAKKVRVKTKHIRTLKPGLLSSEEENTFYSETGEMRGCCVPMCKSNKRWAKVSFHEMPSNEEVREKWVRAICQYGPKKFLDQYALVCGKHFTADDYRPTCTVRCLKPYAVPSVFTDDPECRERESYSKKHKRTARSSESSENKVTEMNLQGTNQLQEEVLPAQNLPGPSVLQNEAKNLKNFEKKLKHVKKGLPRNKKFKPAVTKPIITSEDLWDFVFSGQTPKGPDVSKKKSRKKEVVGSDDVDPLDCAFSVVHPKNGSDVLSDEGVFNSCSFGKHSEISQGIVLETTGNCTTTADTNHLKTTKSSSAFLKRQLDIAQQEISDCQCYITQLKEQNVKLKWEKQSTLVRHLHDIKQDAVDGNYDAIILLNRIVHYSTPEVPDYFS